MIPEVCIVRVGEKLLKKGSNPAPCVCREELIPPLKILYRVLNLSVLI